MRNRIKCTDNWKFIRENIGIEVAASKAMDASFGEIVIYPIPGMRLTARTAATIITGESAGM